MVVGSINSPGPFPHFPVLHGTGASYLFNITSKIILNNYHLFPTELFKRQCHRWQLDGARRVKVFGWVHPVNVGPEVRLVLSITVDLRVHNLNAKFFGIVRDGTETIRL
jgi:hypothetical protein